MSYKTCYLCVVLACVSIFALATPRVLYADDYIPLAPITGEGIAPADQFTRCSTDPNSPDACLPKYLTTLYNMGIALAGLFLVFAIVRGGFTLMFTDSILGKLEGKKIILQAMGGAVIVFSSYLLMETINPQLASNLNLSLKFPRIQIKKFESKLELVPSDTRSDLQKRLESGRVDNYADAERIAGQLLADADIVEQAGDEDAAWAMRDRAYDLILEKGAALSRAEISNAVQAPPNAANHRIRLDGARTNALTAIGNMDRGYRQNLAELENL